MAVVTWTTSYQAPFEKISQTQCFAPNYITRLHVIRHEQDLEESERIQHTSWRERYVSNCELCVNLSSDICSPYAYQLFSYSTWLFFWQIVRLQSREGTRRINCSPQESLSTFFSKVRISSKCEGIFFVDDMNGLAAKKLYLLEGANGSKVNRILFGSNLIFS